MDVCIKQIPDQEWREFKAESARYGIKTGEFFAHLINDHLSSCRKSNWDAVLYGKKTLKGLLTQADAKKIRTEFRAGMTMRSSDGPHS